MKDIDNLSLTLKMIRTLYGRSAKDVAQVLDISPSYFSEIENGKRKPTLEILSAFSKEFNIPLSSLMLMSEEKMFSSSSLELLRHKAQKHALKILQDAVRKSE